MSAAEGPPDSQHPAGWCGRIHAWLNLYKRGALSRRVENLPDVIACIESEAIDGERIARALPPGPAREAARRVVMRLDLINCELVDELLAHRDDATK